MLRISPYYFHAIKQKLIHTVGSPYQDQLMTPEDSNIPQISPQTI